MRVRAAGRTDRARLKGVSPALGGAALFALGLFVVVTGTGLSGVLGMRVEAFGRIDCHDTRTEKGRTVWHCSGESAAQQRANAAERDRVAREALRAHVDGVPRPAEIGRSRILFADHDGRTDPGTITATQVFDGGRWYAHSSTVVGYGMIPLVLGAGAAAWGGCRLPVRGRGAAASGRRGRMATCRGLPRTAARVGAAVPMAVGHPRSLG